MLWYLQGPCSPVDLMYQTLLRHRPVGRKRDFFHIAGAGQPIYPLFFPGLHPRVTIANKLAYNSVTLRRNLRPHGQLVFGFI